MDMNSEVERLRVAFEGFGCQGATALIEYLTSPEAQGLTSIGSSTISEPDLEGIKAESAGLPLRSLHIGSPDGSLTPLEWFADLEKVFDQVPFTMRVRFDALCREMLRVLTAPPPSPAEQAAFKEKLR